MNTRKDFLPWGAVIGIGSLPHHSVDRALTLVRAINLDIPFVPQLPRQTNTRFNMLTEVLWDLLDAGLVNQEYNRLTLAVDRRTEAFQRLHEPAAFAEGPRSRILEKFLAKPPTVTNAIKSQGVGLLTLHSAFRENDHSAELAAALASRLRHLYRYELERLDTLHSLRILVLDEPMLVPEKREEFLPLLQQEQQVLDEIRGLDCLSGVHICGRLSPQLFGLQFDVLSVDCGHPEFGLACLPSYEQLEEFLEKGGLIAWGIYRSDTLEVHSESEVLKNLHSIVEQISLPEGQVYSQSLLSASCGLAALSEIQAKESFLFLQRIENQIRKTYGYEPRAAS